LIDKEPEEAFEILQRFDKEWWLDKVTKYKNINILLEFI